MSRNSLQNLATLRASNLDVAFASAFGTLIGGAFLVGFVQKLGGGDIVINVLSAIPSLAGILQIPGAIFGGRFRSYKRFVAFTGGGWRLLYLPLLFLPLAPIPNEAKLTILTLGVALAAFSGSFGNSVYNDWVAQVIPERSRGFAFARRNAIAAAVGAIVGIVGAAALDAFRAKGQDSLGYTVVYGLALACAALSMFFFLQMGDIRRENPARQSLSEGTRAIATPFRDRAFRRVLLFLALFVAGQTFGGNLFVAFGRESLGLDFKVLQGTAVAMAIGNVAAASAWGFLSDKYGNKPVLAIVGVAVGVTPLAWIACIPGQTLYNTILLLTAHVLMGVVWCGVNLCQFNLILATAKPEDRANYIAAGLALTAIVGGISPLLGGVVMQILRASFEPAMAYKLVFGLTALVRLFSIAFLGPVQELGSAEVRTTLRTISGVSIGGVRAMRHLTRASDLNAREVAIQTVGDQRMDIAADEIIKALHDPLPRVRRQAASTLARLNDPRAVHELVHQLEEHPDLVEEEILEALGQVGGTNAVSPLVQALRSPESRIRRAAVRALGMVGTRISSEELGRTAFEAIIEAASNADDADLRRVAIHALRRMQARSASSVIAEALLDHRPSVRIAAAEAVAEMELTQAARELRESLVRFPDEATAEVAYALGVVGTKDDIPTLLHEAERSHSVITRRRTLLGVARLLGVENAAYRLMLLEGMARDSMLLNLLKPATRRDARLRVALSRFSSGDEAGGLRAAADRYPELAPLAAQPVPEAFLIAAAVIARKA